jgi:hypothetical protein
MIIKFLQTCTHYSGAMEMSQRMNSAPFMKMDMDSSMKMDMGDSAQASGEKKEKDLQNDEGHEGRYEDG